MRRPKESTSLPTASPSKAHREATPTFEARALRQLVRFMGTPMVLLASMSEMVFHPPYIERSNTHCAASTLMLHGCIKESTTLAKL
ncbi:hypothetical protein HAX54_020848 [Datura stramonium]|uniref:Uncharacterized protein n=1 Tax=Datura stramonium TaxID=4076 RepID=A0ABS8UUJ3_DATST|nr:hypothetical protein [Datura stramonium]